MACGYKLELNISGLQREHVKNWGEIGDLWVGTGCAHSVGYDRPSMFWQDGIIEYHPYLPTPTHRERPRCRMLHSLGESVLSFVKKNRLGRKDSTGCLFRKTNTMFLFSMKAWSSFHLPDSIFFSNLRKWSSPISWKALTYFAMKVQGLCGYLKKCIVISLITLTPQTMKRIGSLLSASLCVKYGHLSWTLLFSRSISVPLGCL